MSRLILVDGNSIMNRAFYGIMGSKMLTTADGTYTNAVYGFLAILFKIEEDLKPEYMAVAFDLKGPTKRHEMYQEYKANRHGMPEELAMQMPMIKDVLRAMNIPIIEKQGYEGDDILGTLSKEAEKEGIDVTILSGDRDTFQLASNKVTIRIPRTKMGKTENEDYDRARVLEEYGIEPEQLIEVKGLMGDSSDNIPGIPGVGEKTALNLIKEYQSIDNLYAKIDNNEDNLKGKLKERVVDNKELALLSKELGTINREVPLEETVESLKLQQWNKEEVYKLFQYLRFNRYIDRFELGEDNNTETSNETSFEKIQLKEVEEIHHLKDEITKSKEFIYTTETVEDSNSILGKKIVAIAIYQIENNRVYYIKLDEKNTTILKDILEDSSIKKIGYNLKEEDILCKEQSIDLQGIDYDVKIASYILNPAENKYALEKLAMDYLQINLRETSPKEVQQVSLFDIAEKENGDDTKVEEVCMNAYAVGKLYIETLKKLKETEQLALFNTIEMPLVEVLADMQYQGICADKNELVQFGNTLKEEIQNLTNQIYSLAGEEFNINSTKQLGVILFEKLKLPVIKKTKSGYSTDVDVLEKLKKEHDIIEKILEYRQLMKLNSTYVEGMIPYINEKDYKIHSCFHQTVTATGRISSSDPNLQNIPTRFDLGKQIRKVFKPEPGYVFVDADYSQIELRVLAHISGDEHMIQAFNDNEDIHRETASKVWGIPMEEVTKQQRSDAKAVNFGIVYGISDFGLGEQLGISRKKAKSYIEQYLGQYEKIKEFMENIKTYAQEKGYVETLFNRRRYIPEINSTNYMVRQFGHRIAMNTPIQGTAADIMKIAMITLYHKLKQEKLQSKILLQIHDELLVQVKEEEKEHVKELLQNAMENAMKLKVPLQVELSEANNWYDVK